MLVLTRKRGQRILLSDGVVMTVCHTSCGSVRIGIDAPPDIKILREELQRRMQCEATSQSKTLKRGEKK